MKCLLNLPLVLLLLSSFVTSAQKKYTDIPRTRVSIIIPNGYKLSAVSSMLISSAVHNIQIMDLPGGNLYTNAKDFSKRAFELRGMVVEEFIDTVVSGYKALFLRGNSNYPNTNSMMLVFGDSTFSTSIMSTHPANDSILEEKIKKILLTVRYDKKRKINPFENMKFTVDTISTSFKLKQFAMGMYMYEKINQDTTGIKSVIMVSPIPFKLPMTLDYGWQTQSNSFRNYQQYVKVDSSQIFRINDYEAKYTAGDFYIGVKHIAVYFLFQARKDVALMISGISDFEDKKTFNEIAKFCNTIRIID